MLQPLLLQLFPHQYQCINNFAKIVETIWADVENVYNFERYYETNWKKLDLLHPKEKNIQMDKYAMI